MSTDRELLELAARAAGIQLLDWREDWDAYEDPHRTAAWRTTARQLWNPLTDDGDALRLAVMLELRIDTPSGYGRALVHSQRLERGVCCNDGDEAKYGSDPTASTRRAIVRAAAEIWKKGSAS